MMSKMLYPSCNLKGYFHPLQNIQKDMAIYFNSFIFGGQTKHTHIT